MNFLNLQDFSAYWISTHYIKYERMYEIYDLVRSNQTANGVYYQFPSEEATTTHAPEITASLQSNVISSFENNGLYCILRIINTIDHLHCNSYRNVWFYRVHQATSSTSNGLVLGVCAAKSWWRMDGFDHANMGAKVNLNDFCKHIVITIVFLLFLIISRNYLL